MAKINLNRFLHLSLLSIYVADFFLSCYILNMFGFIIKKSFFDGWDNLLSLVITNLIVLFVTVFIGIFLVAGFDYPVIFIPFFVLLMILLSVFSVAYGQVAAKIADFKGIHISDFFKAIPSSLKDGALFGILVSFIMLVSVFCIKFYVFTTKNMMGFLLGAFIFWIDVIVLMSFQWFVPIRSLLKNDFRKCIKKCLIIFFDNTGFSIAMFIYNLILFVMSFVFAGFFPSIAGLSIADTNAFRILLYKYDYLEQHPELQTPQERKQIPWEELIYEDRETLGPRKLKQMIFPWKD